MRKNTVPNSQFNRHNRVISQPVEPGVSESQLQHEIGNTSYHAERLSMDHNIHRPNGHHEREFHIASNLMTRNEPQTSLKKLHTHFSLPQDIATTSSERPMPHETMIEPTPLDTQSAVSAYSRLATIDPPITKASLSELDLKRIINDPKLRHDQNFETEIAFRPNYYGPRGEQKKIMARSYWAALTNELRMYVEQGHEQSSPSESLSPSCTGSCSCLYSSTASRRLPQMLYTLHEILKSLVPETEWFSIDQTLDVDFLMQQLQKGVCDLKGLSDWLGQLLMGSCSPCRDSTVLKMVTTIQEAVAYRDAQALVDGIEQIFVILETMKLDVANHQIRELKFLMIDDSVQFEQRYFLSKIQSGLQVEDSRQWYDSAAQQEHPREPANGLAAFATPVIDLVVENEPQFPATFTFDFDRLRALRVEFQTCMYQDICCKALDRIVRSFGYIASSPQDTYEEMLHRISEIQSSLSTNNGMPVQSDEVALEIVRAAYSSCNTTHLPTDQDVAETARFLELAMDVNSVHYQQLQCSLCSELEDIVDEELDIISAFTPLQILNYYHHSATHPRRSARRGGLQEIGERLAHIIILHWWTWAPILYLQPRQVASPPPPSHEQDTISVRQKSLSLPAFGTVREDGPRGSSTTGQNRAKEAP